MEGVVVDGVYTARVDVAAEDSDEVGGCQYRFEEGTGAGVVSRFGPALTALGNVVAVFLGTPIGVSTKIGAGGRSHLGKAEGDVDEEDCG